MKLSTFCFLLFSLFIFIQPGNAQKNGETQNIKLIEADNKNIQYTGRIDFTDPKKPRFWAPGVYIKAKFKGTSCEIVINDEVLWGNSHNYIEIVIDETTLTRIQTTDKVNTIKVAEGLPYGEHTITICKNTESGIGYLEFVGFKCSELVPMPPKPSRKLEFFGNSITCGTGSDLTIPCDKGPWYDQHNAYMAYGPRIARQLNAQWHLTAASGIGLIHSCCDMKVVMPQVFDKLNFSNNTGSWNFSLYQPDALTICLGQNDGILDSTVFCSTYVKFIGELRTRYPQTRIVCITSPMADATLATSQKKYLTGIVNYMNNAGDKKVHKFFFSKGFNNGCGGHPDMADHGLIANELSAFFKEILNW